MEPSDHEVKRSKTTNQEKTVVRPFDQLPEEMIKLILKFVSDDAQSLTRCLVLDKRFHDLVTKSETVNYRLNQRRKINIKRVKRIFPSLRYMRMQTHPFLLRFFSAGTCFTRWKAVASTRGLLHVMITVTFLMAPLRPSGPQRTPQFVGPFEFHDVKVDKVAAMVMLELRDHLLPGCSLKSLTFWSASDGKLVIGEEDMKEIESELRMDYDLSGYNKMPLHRQHWFVPRIELPINNSVARVNVAVVKRSNDPIELERDVLLLVDAFKEDEEDLEAGWSTRSPWRSRNIVRESRGD